MTRAAVGQKAYKLKQTINLSVCLVVCLNVWLYDVGDLADISRMMTDDIEEGVSLKFLQCRLNLKIGF